MPRSGVVAWRGLVRGAVVALVAASMLVMCTAATAAVVAPNGRTYERITPQDKNGGDASVGALLDGDNVHYLTTSAFLPNEVFFDNLGLYFAKRDDGIWPMRTGYVAPKASVVDLSDDRSRELILQTCSPCNPLTADDTDSSGDIYARSGGTIELVSKGSEGGNSGDSSAYAGASPDGTHVLFETPEHLEPADTGRVAGTQLYERIGTQTRVVGLDSDENLISDSGAVLGHGASSFDPAGASNAISADGSRIFFESPDPATFGNNQLYARTNGEDTVHVSASQCDREAPDPPCSAEQPVIFQGASKDGQEVFFTTAGQLVDDDADDAADLYGYSFGTQQLTLITQDCTDADGSTVDCEVEGVVGVSDDGSRVYFAGGPSQPTSPGTGSIWLYDRAVGSARFVAASTGGNAYSNQGISTPQSGAYMTPDGGTLVFDSDLRLTSFDNSQLTCKLIDSGGVPFFIRCPEVYRYSADADELDCVSCNAAGVSPIGAATIRPAIEAGKKLSGMHAARHPNAVATDDGNTVVFETADKLVSEDTNQRVDVYEWTDGSIALLGTGTSTVDSKLAGITPDGKSIVFATLDRLVPSDTDAQADLYEARVGGKAEVPPDVKPECEGEACQPSTAPPTFGTPGSSLFDGPGDGSSSPKPAITKLVALSKAQRAALARGRKAVLRVRVSRAGTVRLTAQAKFKGRQRAVASARKRAKKAGTVKLAFRLNRGARAYLEPGSGHRLRVVLSVRLSDAGAKRMTIVLASAEA